MSPISYVASGVELVEFLDFSELNFANVFDSVEPSDVPISLKALLDDLAPVSMVVERTYVDADSLACHNVQAARSFTPVVPNTTRVHFFDQKVDRELVECNDGDVNEELQKHYLGFAVIRPDDPATIGRTLIRPPEKLGSRAVSSAVKAEFQVSLLGQSLRIRACPYMSQDEKVIACATAGLWMATTPLARKDPSTRSCPTPEITRLALGLNRGFSPSIGTAGLTFEQSLHALLALGYDPYHLEYPPASDLYSLCAAYTDGGFAPLLYVRLPRTAEDPDVRHVVTVVGHSDSLGYWSASPKRDKDGNRVEQVSITPSDGRVIIHDDRQGMYLPARMLDKPPRQSGDATAARPPSDHATWLQFDDTQLRSGWVQSVTVPLPNTIMADHSQALFGAALSLDTAWESGAADNAVILLRPMLVRSRNFKDSLYRRDRMPDVVRTFYRRLPMPLYVWLVELSYQPDAKTSEPPLVFGEILLDSSRPGLKASSALAEHYSEYIGGSFISGYTPTEHWEPISDPATYPGYRPGSSDRPRIPGQT